MPADVHFGEIAGVAVNSKGNIFVFSRGNSTGPAYMATAAQLLEFDAKGKFVREIGKNNFAWAYAHAVRIDKQDNIWIVDKGSNMILKMNPQGRVVWVFGRKGESSHLDVPPDYASQLAGLLQRAGVAITVPAEQQPAQSAAGASRQRVQPADRRGVGLAGQLLLHRRLCQLARRQGERERRVGCRAGDRSAMARGSSIRRTASRWRRRTKSMLPIAATAASRCLDPDRQVPPRIHDRRAGRSIPIAARSSYGAAAPRRRKPARRRPARPMRCA